MSQKLFFLLFFLLSVYFASAQAPSDPKKTEEIERLQKEAVALLRETMAEVNSMRSLENRLSFSSEMASLMWFHDEKEARAMYLSVTTDFRQLLVEFDTQLANITLIEAAEEDTPVPGGLFFGDSSSKGNVARKFRKALEMRKQFAMSLAEHEPDMAMAFYYDSAAGLASTEGRNISSGQDSSFELQLMTQVAESNAAKAAQYGTKSIDKGVDYQHLELLKKIYAKDVEKGIEFASAMIGKIKSGKTEAGELYVVSSLIRFGEETAAKPAKGEAKKPVMTTQDLRDLAEVIAKTMLNSDEEAVMGGGYMSLLEKYVPTRAAQIKAKFKNLQASQRMSSNVSANVVTASGYGTANAANSAVAGPANPEAERRAKALEEKMEAERKLMEDVAGLGTKSLPKEERTKIITQARKMIVQKSGKDNKIAGLSLLAAHVAKAGDKELANEIMKDAESLVNPLPKNYQDFMLSWMLISGYAEVDTNRAFLMLTDTIHRLNETISAMIKSAEFIDVQGEMIADGEVQVGQFGGSMLRSLTKDLKIAEPTLRSLAKADFAKTKAVTNSFDRAEVRVLAKMMVLRTILNTKDPSTKEDPNIGLVLN